MAHIWYEAISLTMSSSGDYTAYSTGVFTGFVQAIAHSVSGSAEMSTTCVVSIAGEKGLSIFTSTAGSTAWQVYPRAYPDGVAKLSTSTGQATASYECIPLADERIVVTLSSQATAAGCAETFKVWIGG